MLRCHYRNFKILTQACLCRMLSIFQEYIVSLMNDVFHQEIMKSKTHSNNLII